VRDRPLHLPLAYNGDGLISSADRRRFARIYNGACASGKGSRFHFPRLPETARAVDELRSEEGRPGEAPAGARPPAQAPLSPATARSARHLCNVFDGLVDRQTELSQELRQKLHGSRRKVDKLYETTRSEIAAAARNGGRALACRHDLPPLSANLGAGRRVSIETHQS